jgi:large subunit ribosomal protein L21
MFNDSLEGSNSRMYAIVETGGLQYRVEEGDVIRVPMLVGEPGGSHELDRVLAIGGDEQRIGKPVVEGAKVQTTVVSHGKGEKAIIFKKKKRTDYYLKRGHRQDFTELKIEKIIV